MILEVRKILADLNQSISNIRGEFVDGGDNSNLEESVTSLEAVRASLKAVLATYEDDLK